MLANHTHTNYLYRMTSLYAIAALGPIVGTEVLCSSMLPLVLAMGADPVPNVRFNVAKTLRQLLPLLDATTIAERVRPCLLTLAEDSDSDASYFANQALQGC